MSGSRWLVVIGLMLPVTLALAVAAWWQTREPAADIACTAWREHYRQLDDARAVELIRQAGQREGTVGSSRGLPALVAALTSGRAALVQEAKLRLVERLNRWSLLEPDEIEPRQIELLELLAREIRHADASAQRIAVDLALRILAEPATTDVESSGRMLAACESILQTREPAPATIVSDVPSTPAGGAPSRASDPAANQPRTAALQAPIGAQLRLPPLPRALLAPTRTDESPRGGSSNGSHRGSLPGSEPRRIDNVPGLQPLDSTTGPTLAPGQSARPALAVLSALGPASLIDLLSAWHDASPGDRATIERELSRRGITARQIEIGLGLTSPKMTERRQWLDQLPRLTGIDPKPWLLWLSRDEQSEIRLAALQIMSTAPEPAFQRRAGEMALGDGDAQVREVAQRVTRGANDSSLRR